MLTFFTLPMYNISQPLPGPVQPNNQAEIAATVLIVIKFEKCAHQFLHGTKEQKPLLTKEA